MKKIREKKRRKGIIILSIALLLLSFYVLQRFWAHRHGNFIPDYARVLITEDSDYDTIFLQTGLGKEAVDKLEGEKDFKTVLEVQEAFFSEDEVECVSIFGYFTMSDRVKRKDTAPLVDLQPGDIILSLSTHSVGWNHGHVGLVLDEESVLECTTLGRNSSIVKAKHWRTYSNYVVLRVKGATEKLCQEVAAYAKENLCHVPYHLSAGFIGAKAPASEEPYFGLQCAYLAWYAWQCFGYDLDSDGGRLVTAYDILHSKLIEVVQIYGMDPRKF